MQVYKYCESCWEKKGEAITTKSLVHCKAWLIVFIPPGNKGEKNIQYVSLFESSPTTW